MPSITTPDWNALLADPRFQELHRRKSRFLWGLMAFSVLWYFALPVGAGWFPQTYARRVWGPVNVGLLMAWSEFAVAWGVAWWYARRASTHFDALAAELARDAGAPH
jgi:uncharacterized membrane protein (DUF485 family)